MEEDNVYESNFSISGDEGHQVICPICGCNGVHITDVHKDTNISNGNQGNASVEFWGECGHSWIIVFDGHKGDVYEATVIITQSAKLLNKGSFA
jgi:hypothetical protein